MSEVAFRSMVAADEGFVYSNVLRDWRQGDVTPLPDDLWFPAARELLTRLLASREVSVFILHPTDSSQEILGYVIAEGKCLWASYLRKSFRDPSLKLHEMLLEKVGNPSHSAWQGQQLRPRSRDQRRLHAL